ncbi:hypothetical protein F5884DRAFT_779589 [Xylogone sp. PMI_703]|nr:hypothetical protein F5884DRAFT_779589 [Xylogone sp. PMI_703]
MPWILKLYCCFCNALISFELGLCITNEWTPVETMPCALLPRCGVTKEQERDSIQATKSVSPFQYLDLRYLSTVPTWFTSPEVPCSVVP